MTKILILGSTGMLGSAIKSELLQSHFNIFTSRRGIKPNLNSHGYRFDFFEDDLRTWFDNKQKFDYVINCIGAIPQKYIGKPETEIRLMYELNSMLPHFLNHQSELHGFRVIQIATDCVFSGKSGKYSEKSKHDANDVYGVSKSIGEKYSPNAMLLRCSIIGKHDVTNTSLHNWFLASKKRSTVNGYTNHLWNGITTVAFARIVKGVIEKQLFASGLQHIVPLDEVSKYDLLKIIAVANNRYDIKIMPVKHGTTIDRTLSSDYPSNNELLWLSGGYSSVQSISELIFEMDS